MNGVERLPLNVLLALQTLLKMVDYHLWSGSWSPVPPSAVMCSLGEALASVIVLALRPCPASKGVQLIAELNAVL